MGGRAAEELIFGEVSTGAHDDLTKATNIARGMVRSYGMSEAIGPLVLDREPSPMFGMIDHRREEPGALSEAVAREVDAEVRRIVEAAYARACRLLASRLKTLKLAAATLLERESLSGEELAELVDPVPDDVRSIAAS